MHTAIATNTKMQERLRASCGRNYEKRPKYLGEKQKQTNKTNLVRKNGEEGNKINVMIHFKLFWKSDTPSLSSINHSPSEWNYKRYSVHFFQGSETGLQ